MTALRVHLTSPATVMWVRLTTATVLVATGLSLAIAGHTAATDGAWSTWVLLGLGLVWAILQLAIPDPRPADNRSLRADAAAAGPRHDGGGPTAPAPPSSGWATILGGRP